MPTLENLDYAAFSYDEAESKPLTLDEAVIKSNDLRRNDKENFYRIQAVDKGMTGFRVEKVPVAAAYAEFLARIAKTLAQYTNRSLNKR